MSSIRETSQQDRRVYVGNLSYDVKWHHLKDFMRQGMFGCFWWHLPYPSLPNRACPYPLTTLAGVTNLCFVAGEVLFAEVLQLPNGMSKVGAYT